MDQPFSQQPDHTPNNHTPNNEAADGAADEAANKQASDGGLYGAVDIDVTKTSDGALIEKQRTALLIAGTMEKLQGTDVKAASFYLDNIRNWVINSDELQRETVRVNAPLICRLFNRGVSADGSRCGERVEGVRIDPSPFADAVFSRTVRQLADSSTYKEYKRQSDGITVGIKAPETGSPSGHLSFVREEGTGIFRATGLAPPEIFLKPKKHNNHEDHHDPTPPAKQTKANDKGE